jgi:hypothetical protein
MQNVFPLLVANPPLPVPVVYTYNDITDLNDKPWDLLTHADQACWIVASLADSDHKRINISINTALLLMDLFEDKAFFFGWEQLVSIPISGNGLFGPASATLSNGKPVMSVNITAQLNVLQQWMSVSLLAWLDVPFAPPDNCLVVTINPNAANNLGLVCRYKIQLCILNKLVLLTIRNHITQDSFKTFLAHKHEFAFCDEKFASVVLRGLILLCKIIEISKPETIIKVRHLKVKLDSIKLWPDMENNVCNLTSKMLQVLQEIHAKSGVLSYTERCFITNVFHASLTSPTKKFVTFVNTLKNCWIMEEVTDQATILTSLNKMYKNIVANRTWVNSNDKDTKIVTLTTQLKQATKKLNELKKKVQTPTKLNHGNKHGGADTSKKTTRDQAELWRITKKGSTINHDGKKFDWCPHRKSKDGNVNGMYMPSPHDHDAWAKAKAEREEKFKCGKRGAEVTPDKTSNAPVAKKHKAGDFKLKLSNKITSALVTQHHLSQQEANAVFTDAFKEATNGVDKMSLN